MSVEERLQRVQRLQEDALRRKLRNVRLISSVERLADRASSLRELTDRLRLIKVGEGGYPASWLVNLAEGGGGDGILVSLYGQDCCL